MIINLFNIVLKVNIQTNKHFDANEYFIAIGIIYNVYIHEWPEGISTLTYIYTHQTMGLVKTLLSEAHVQIYLINRLGPSHGPY